MERSITNIKFLILLSLLSLPLAAADRQKPNVMILFGDDLGRYASAYADPQKPSPNDLISTPAFDRIAREGALFHIAHVSALSCTPSRAALLTGRHFFRNGSHANLHHPQQNGHPAPFDSMKGMPVLLEDAGYHIGHTYKVHVRESLIGGKKISTTTLAVA